MSNDKRDSGPNPPLVIGAPAPLPSREELISWHARNGTLASFLMHIGEYRDYAFERAGFSDSGRTPER